MATGEAVERFLARRRHLLARLEHVNGVLRRWNEYEANAHLPPDLRRDLAAPSLARDAAQGLHRRLADELARLDG
jgi:hypothetical protein